MSSCTLTVPFSARSGLIFVGSYEHAPNADAVTYSSGYLAPCPATVPTALFRIVGSGVTPEVQALSGSGVEVIGFVDDLDAILAQSGLLSSPCVTAQA